LALSPRKPAYHLHSPRPAAPTLQELLERTAAAASASELDAVLRTARGYYAGSMLEQLEGVAAERARFLLETRGGGPDA
jgi:hypothetical protein